MLHYLLRSTISQVIISIVLLWNSSQTLLTLRLQIRLKPECIFNCHLVSLKASMCTDGTIKWMSKLYLCNYHLLHDSRVYFNKNINVANVNVLIIVFKKSIKSRKQPLAHFSFFAIVEPERKTVIGLKSPVFIRNIRQHYLTCGSSNALRLILALLV